MIAPEFEDMTERDQVERKEKLKSMWAQNEAIVEHFERRLEAMAGKALVVCMSRRICGERRAPIQLAPRR
jgi:type I restriction enzyme R subunit